MRNVRPFGNEWLNSVGNNILAMANSPAAGTLVEFFPAVDTLVEYFPAVGRRVAYSPVVTRPAAYFLVVDTPTDSFPAAAGPKGGGRRVA